MGKNTRTGGRDATTAVVRGDFGLSIGDPGTEPPPGFTWRALADLARLESGHTPSRRKPEYWGGSIPWIGIRDATGNHGRTIFDTQQHATQLGIDNSSARILPAETVCLSRTASVGYVVKMGVPMATSQDFVNWICGPHLDSDYLRYLLIAEQASVRRFAYGSVHPTLYYPDAKALHVCIPSLDEQRRIVMVLSALDDLIETNLALVRDHWAAAEAAFQRTRFLGEPTRLGEVLTLRYGKSLPASRRVPGPFPVVSSAGITGSHASALVEGPGVVVGRKGTVGSVTWVFEDFFPIDTAFYVETELPMLFAYFALSSAGLDQMNTDSAVPGLNRDNALQRPASMPSGSALTDFTRVTDPLMLGVRQLRDEIVDLTRTRDDLLRLLMSGRVRVADLEVVA